MQLFEGAVIGAVESAFIAHQQSEALSVIGEVAKDPSQATGVIRVVELPSDVLGVACHFLI